MTLFITTRPIASQATLEDKNVSHLLMPHAQHKHDHGPGRHQQANSSKVKSFEVCVDGEHTKQRKQQINNGNVVYRKIRNN